MCQTLTGHFNKGRTIVSYEVGYPAKHLSSLYLYGCENAEFCLDPHQQTFLFLSSLSIPFFSASIAVQIHSNNCHWLHHTRVATSVKTTTKLHLWVMTSEMRFLHLCFKKQNKQKTNQKPKNRTASPEYLLCYLLCSTPSTHFSVEKPTYSTELANPYIFVCFIFMPLHSHSSILIKIFCFQVPTSHGSCLPPMSKETPDATFPILNLL